MQAAQFQPVKITNRQQASLRMLYIYRYRHIQVIQLGEDLRVQAAQFQPVKITNRQ